MKSHAYSQRLDRVSFVTLQWHFTLCVMEFNSFGVKLPVPDG
jgi:hypothetical protein